MSTASGRRYWRMITACSSCPWTHAAGDHMLDHPADSSSRYPAARFMFYLAKMLKEEGYVGGCIAMLRTAADLGCSDSMVLLGDILVDGGQADKKEAMDYFVKASELGNDMGMRNAGYCYALGIGCEKDKKA